METTTAGGSATVAAQAHRSVDKKLESRMFSTLAILLLVLSTLGFLGSGVTLARAGRDLATLRIVLHGVAGFLWLSFFVLQTQLVLRRRVSLHRSLGKVGVVLFIFLIAATTNLLLTAPATYPEIPADRMSSDIVPRLMDLLQNTVFFSAAIVWRNRPFVHKRLIFFVTVGLSSTGFVRLPTFFTGRQSPVFGVLLALALAAVVFAHDWRRHRGWNRWFMPLCFVAMFAITFAARALLDPLVFYSEAWQVFLER